MAKDNMFPMYLGDGVYASFDGYHILLYVGSHNLDDAVVALEPDVMKELIKYNDALDEKAVMKRGLNDAQVRET